MLNCTQLPTNTLNQIQLHSSTLNCTQLHSSTLISSFLIRIYLCIFQVMSSIYTVSIFYQLMYDEKSQLFIRSTTTPPVRNHSFPLHTVPNLNFLSKNNLRILHSTVLNYTYWHLTALNLIHLHLTALNCIHLHSIALNHIHLHYLALNYT